MPGDFTPQSRFVRAAILNFLAEQPEDAKAVDKIFHLLNQSDIPYGAVMVTDSGLPQYTQYTSAFDLEKKKVYISTYENRQLQGFELTEELASRSEVSVSEIIREQQIVSLDLV